MTTGRKYPPEMLEFVRENAPGRSNQELLILCQERFGEDVITLSSLIAYKKNNHIVSGLTGWFRKGHEPANKGLRWNEFISPDGQRRIRQAGGIFAKGHKPFNTLPVGSVVVNKYGYTLKKVRESGGQWERWQFVHRLVWEEHNGPVPAGHAIMFADHNKRNCSIENLALVSNRQRSLISRLGLKYWDKTSLETAMRIADLKSTAKQRRKGHVNQNQQA